MIGKNDLRLSSIRHSVLLLSRESWKLCLMGARQTTEKMEEEKKMKKHFDTPRTSDGEEIRVKGLKMHFHQEMPKENRKRKEPIPSSSSDSQEESESDEEEILRREARRVEKEMRREEKKAQREAELRMKAKEVKKKRFEVKVNRTPDGVPVSRSGRTLRTPMATWAGESITYDVHGNAVEMRGVTTTTKMTVGKTNMNENDRLAAHYGIDSPLNTSIQKERAIAPPAASLPKTPAPRKSKAENRGYSDDETDQKMFFDHYMSMLASQAEATPAFILKKGKRRLRVVESSDSEAEAEVRRKEKKRREKEERRRLKESEEEDGSSDEVWKRKKKVTSKKKTVTVKKEKQVKRAPSKKRKTRKEESEEEEDEEGESEVEIEHDEDAVTFVLSDEGSNARGNGYSDDDLVMSEEEEEEVKRKKNKKEKKPAVKRGKAWKEEELKRLKLAIQAADPSSTAGGWEIVAKSLEERERLRNASRWLVNDSK
ncbi:hypothetical protein PENTCL1PPCAC_26809 [Pristionchus entomophagus]|uniref:Myb-like domain-containing protein n=1 Tax=Pristionchus entomophagus TaxID=358040 RepID=A0AAV5UEY8_9BILA|nr:hypothetical protein PENTCL1PPCAC_26809 [Pristionchus entomophagus]